MENTCGLHAYVEDDVKEIKLRLCSIDDSIKDLSGMFAEITISKNDRELIRKSLNDILEEYRGLHSEVTEIKIDRERTLAKSEIEHNNMRKDIDGAHDAIRCLVDSNNKKFDKIILQMSGIQKEILKVSFIRKTFLWVGGSLMVAIVTGLFSSNLFWDWIRKFF